MFVVTIAFSSLPTSFFTSIFLKYDRNGDVLAQALKQHAPAPELAPVTINVNR